MNRHTTTTHRLTIKMRIRQFCTINVVQNEDNLHTKGRVDSIPATQLIYSLVN